MVVAGILIAPWVLVVGFGAWLYVKKRKQYARP